MTSAGTRLRRPAFTVALAATAAIALAACSSSSGGGGAASSGSGGGSLPATVNIFGIIDTTGAGAFATVSENKGIQLAVEEINANKVLGNTKLNFVPKDSGYVATVSATLISEAIADPTYSVIIGPLNSAAALATAPIATAAKTPIIFNQAGVAGVVISPYTYRMTAPTSSYYGSAQEFLQKKNVKKVAIIYNSATPTQVDNEKVVQDNAKKYGYTVTTSTAVQNTTSDFSAAAQKVAADKPDAIYELLVGTQHATATTALRQAGFNGPIMGTTASGAQNLVQAGADAHDYYWSTDFTATSTVTEAQKFTKAYQAKFNEVPLNFAAEGYDTVYVIAKALEKAGSGDREKVNTALSDVMKAGGIKGAMGTLNFEKGSAGGYDLRITGTIVQWDYTAKTEILPK